MIVLHHERNAAAVGDRLRGFATAFSTGRPAAATAARRLNCLPVVKNCVVSNVSNGILPNGNGADISYNIIGPIKSPSYSGVVDHANSIETLGNTGVVNTSTTILFLAR